MVTISFGWQHNS